MADTADPDELWHRLVQCKAATAFAYRDFFRAGIDRVGLNIFNISKINSEVRGAAKAGPTLKP